MKFIKNHVIFICILLTLTFFLGYKVGHNGDKDTQNLQSDRWSFCEKMVKDYIAFQSTKYSLESDSKEWAMTIDVETDLMKLCQLNLDEVSLSSFQSTVTAKYSK